MMFYKTLVATLLISFVVATPAVAASHVPTPLTTRPVARSR